MEYHFDQQERLGSVNSLNLLNYMGLQEVQHSTQTPPPLYTH